MNIPIKYQAIVLLRSLAISVFLYVGNLYAEVVEIDSQQLKQLTQSGVVLIDVRTPGEWKQTGVVENSIPIMFFNERRQPLTEQWMQQVSQLVNADGELILICRSGSRSRMIANYLTQQHKFVRVYNVKHGISDWIAKGNTTVAIK